MPRAFRRSFPKSLVVPACLVIGALQIAGCSSREDRAQSYYESGMSYLKKDDYAKARLELRNALQLKGDLIGAWRALVQVDQHDRNFQSLSEDLRRITELDTKDVQARSQLARLYLASGAVSEALKVTNSAEELDPRNPEILALKAAILFRLKDTGGAIREASKALQIDPTNTDAIVILSVDHLVSGDPDNALKTLETVSEAHKNDLGVLVLKVNIYNRKGEPDKVEELLRQLIALHPNEPAFRTQLIRFYLTQKRPDEAEKELRTTIAKNPNDVAAELELVNLLGGLKGRPAARSELVNRINAGGNIFPFQLALAKLDFSGGDVDESVKLLETLIKSSSAENAITARVTLAQIYLGKKNAAAAGPLINDTLNADSRNIEALRLRAIVRMDRGQFDDAIADLRRALNDQPRAPALLATLALAYERSGSIELADKAYFDATKAADFNPTFGLNYVAFLERRGLSEQAESILVQLAGRNPNSVPVLSALAKVKLARQDWVGAHQAADAIRNITSKSDVADEIHAAAFSGQQKFSDSLTLLKDAYNTNPDAVQPLAALVGVYLRAKQTENAENFLNEVLKANPRNAEALALMGTVQLVKNNPAEAEKNFKGAINEQPKSPLGYAALAELYARQGKADDAVKVVRTGLDQNPGNFQLRLTYAGLLELKHEYEPAISEYESILKDQPGSMIVANNLASLLTDHRTDKASLEKAKSIALLLKNSQLPQFKDTLGWVSYQNGDYATATSLLEDAASKLPGLSLVHYHLGMAYLANSQTEKAQAEFKKARDLAPNDADLKTKIDAAFKNKNEKPPS